MSTVAQLEVESVTVEAGSRVSVPLNVRNTGEVVEDYLIDIVGVPSAWTTVEPAHFTLYPGTAQEATVDIHPPRSSGVPAGAMQFGVHVVPTEHPDQAVVPEAVVEVLPYLDTTAELVPRTTHGRFGAKHQVAIDNRGNVPVTVLLDPAVDSTALEVTASPKALTVDPGMAAFADLRVTSTERLWRGNPRTLPFSLVVAPQGSPEVRLEAAHVQDPVLPKWLLKALLAALALLLLLLALWFLALERTIASAAQGAVEQPVKQAQADAAEAKQAAGQAGAAQTQAAGSASEAKKALDTIKPSGGAGPTVTPSPTVQLVTAPASGRLTVSAAAGRADTDTFRVPAGGRLTLTDFVLENTQGDSGLLTITVVGPGDADRVLLRQALESFRTTDYHFVTPFVAPGGATLELTMRCNRVGTPPDQAPAPTSCSNALTYGGQLTERATR